MYSTHNRLDAENRSTLNWKSRWSRDSQVTFCASATVYHSSQPSHTVKILIVHEVNYLSKIIYEFQILPEILSILGHEVVVIDYNDSWESEAHKAYCTFRTEVHRAVYRAYPGASITVRRPGMIRAP